MTTRVWREEKRLLRTGRKATLLVSKEKRPVACEYPQRELPRLVPEVPQGQPEEMGNRRASWATLRRRRRC